jgi:hypothetical protein
MKNLDYIIQKALKTIVSEQAPAPVSKETNNAPGDAIESPFTPAEEKFLGKFDAYGTTHIGIIYSTSDIGIREFITRSGADLNITVGILASLLKQKVIKIVPYTGFGRNTDYTIELQLSLDDVKGLGAEDKAKAEAGSSASGAAPAGETSTPAAPAPEVAWVVKYGDILKESVTIAKSLVTEKTTKSDVIVPKSRMLKQLPKDFIYQLERIIDMINKKTKTKQQKERLVADILDNLQLNLDLSAKQIRQSYDFHKNQKRLQKELEKNK